MAKLLHRLRPWAPSMTFGEGAFLTLGFWLGMLVMTDWDPAAWRTWLEAKASDANWVEAAGTWATTFVAIGGFFTLGRQHRKEREARIAGEVLTLTIDFCNALRGTVRDATTGIQIPYSDRLHWDGETLERWDREVSSSEFRTQLEKVRTQVRAFLPNRFRDAVEELWRISGALSMDFGFAALVARMPQRNATTVRAELRETLRSKNYPQQINVSQKNITVLFRELAYVNHGDEDPPDPEEEFADDPDPDDLGPDFDVVVVADEGAAPSADEPQEAASNEKPEEPGAPVDPKEPKNS